MPARRGRLRRRYRLGSIRAIRRASAEIQFRRRRAAARETSPTAPFDQTPPELPEALSKLDFDAWRDIRFRPDKAFLGANGSLFRLQLFHLGHLFSGR